jgi:energy-coupling factor transporter ATP-binding protein EcfA2
VSLSPETEPTAVRTTWEAFLPWWRANFKLGEHISVIGPTGTGKTTLGLELIGARPDQVVVATKRQDDVLDKLPARGYAPIPRWPRGGIDGGRVLLWPRGGSTTAERYARQSERISEALEAIFDQGGWTVLVDEARVVADPAYLGLRHQINELLIQGRTSRISMVLGFQRPAWVPPEAYDQPSYLFIAADNDRKNVIRFKEIGGADGELVAETVKRLRKYEWAMVDARPGRGAVAVVKVTKPAGRRLRRRGCDGSR